MANNKRIIKIISVFSKNSEDLTIELGRTNITGAEPPRDPFIRRVIRIDRHKHYDQPSYNNDIAILTLDAPLSFGRWVATLPIREGSSL